MHVVLLFFLSTLSLVFANTGEVKTLTWDTINAAPPAELNKGQKDLLSLIRFGVSAFPEATVMNATFIGGAGLGLPPEMAKNLQSLLSKRYQIINSDEVFSKSASALSYCYSVVKPKEGLVSLYIPNGASEKSNIIMFLHGYGGSFKFYLHYLAETFPDHIIICPAYGISCSHVPSAYLQESLESTEKELGYKLQKPLLIGLSAGGFGGFREYTKNSRDYVGYICMAAFPPSDILRRLPQDGRVRVVAGGNESFVKNKTLYRTELSIKRRIINYKSHLIPKHDHFFMLSAEEQTKKVLINWSKELSEGF